MAHSPYSLPLAVAVTGHRDIAPENEESLRQAIRQRLALLQQSHPNTPLLALSGLAEGADMLFAEAALELGIELVAVLAAEPEEFRKDFATPAHPGRTASELKQRFGKILEQSSDVVTVRAGKFAKKSERYTRVGAYLVRRCHVLFALWDGSDTQQPGGTSHVVELARQGVPDRLRESPLPALDFPDAVTIHHLLTPRKNVPLKNACTWRVISPETVAPQAPQHTHQLAELERFNKAATHFIAYHPAAVATSKGYLQLSSQDLTVAEERILKAYAVADAMAMACQRKSIATLRIIYGISLFMLLTFAVYSQLFHSIWLYFAYYLALLAGGCLFLWDRRKRIYKQFVEYRGLAEGLRVQLFYRIGGVRNFAADLYLRKQRSELGWIRQAMRALETGSRREEPRTDIVLECWIRDQARYFFKARQRDRAKLQRFNRIGTVGFISGIVCGLFGFLAEACGLVGHNSLLMHWLFLLMGLCPAIGALTGSYAFRLGLKQHVREYDKMGTIFQLALEKAQAPDVANDVPTDAPVAPEVRERYPYTRLQLLIRELGREALADNAQWVMLHRELKPVLPTK